MADVPTLAFNVMPLDAEVDDLSVGATLLIQLQLYQNPPSNESLVSGTAYLFERKSTKFPKLP
ncbi:hypothetical protein HC766_07300 [Candidatus Gracilibacteria bacterium]|nr:hypothetical protein [Candidatus Gracilibacteria bacterium]